MIRQVCPLSAIFMIIGAVRRTSTGPAYKLERRSIAAVYKDQRAAATGVGAG